MTSLPKHLVSVPLHSPDERHSLTAEPTSMNPKSHVKIAVDPYVIWVPILFPFGGTGSSPHEMTKSVKQDEIYCTHYSKANI